MKVIFLDIDGVLAIDKNFGTRKEKLWKKDKIAEQLKVPYMWDEKCVMALNRLVLRDDLQIVLSSDWKMHWNLDEMAEIFRINGVCRSPIGYTHKHKTNMTSSLESDRVKQILDWVEQNCVTTWCAVDDMDLSELGPRFVQTDSRMGIAEPLKIEKLSFSLFPSAMHAPFSEQQIKI